MFQNPVNMACERVFPKTMPPKTSNLMLEIERALLKRNRTAAVLFARITPCVPNIGSYLPQGQRSIDRTAVLHQGVWPIKTIRALRRGLTAVNEIGREW